MDLLTKVSKHHKEWLNIANTFGGDYAEDVVQEMYLRVHKYGKKDKVLNELGEINLFYIWSMLRNAWGDANKANKIEFISLDNVYTVKDYDQHLEKQEALEKINKLIELEMSKWHFYDNKLFELYRNTDLSIREIADKLDINYTSIFHTLKRCKQRIKEAVGEDYQDYLNEDFELIK
jgi:RNA polymerase sigma factor (sigma-70 family)